MQYQFEVGQKVVFEVAITEITRRTLATVTAVWRNGVAKIDIRPAYTFDEYGQRRGGCDAIRHASRIRPLAPGETPESIAGAL